MIEENTKEAKRKRVESDIEKATRALESFEGKYYEEKLTINGTEITITWRALTLREGKEVNDKWMIKNKRGVFRNLDIIEKDLYAVYHGCRDRDPNNWGKEKTFMSLEGWRSFGNRGGYKVISELAYKILEASGMGPTREFEAEEEGEDFFPSS